MGTMASAVGTRANYNEASSHSIDVLVFASRIRALASEPLGTRSFFPQVSRVSEVVASRPLH